MRGDRGRAYVIDSGIRGDGGGCGGRHGGDGMTMVSGWWRQIDAKDKSGLGYDSHELTASHLNQGEVFESAFDSSVNECEDTNHQVHDRHNSDEGYHAVPPPYTGNFMPPKPDLVIANEDECVAKRKAESSESKPKSISAPIIEDWVSDSEDENE
nr:hypothetical protein [Tanacetum cinerariifolium]